MKDKGIGTPDGSLQVASIILPTARNRTREVFKALRRNVAEAQIDIEGCPSTSLNERNSSIFSFSDSSILSNEEQYLTSDTLLSGAPFAQSVHCPNSSKQTFLEEPDNFNEPNKYNDNSGHKLNQNDYSTPMQPPHPSKASKPAQVGRMTLARLRELCKDAGEPRTPLAVINLPLSCQLFSEIDPCILSYGEVQQLHLQQNLLTEVSPYLSQLKHLRCLFLQGNQIVDVHAESLRGLSELRVLDLSGNKIQKIHEESFSNVPKLETLLLSDNELRDAPALKPLLACPTISDLDLGGNPISDPKIVDDLLALMPHLQTLVLTRTPIAALRTCDSPDNSGSRSILISKPAEENSGEEDKILNPTPCQGLTFHYRRRTISMCPLLTCLDHRPISNSERRYAEEWWVQESRRRSRSKPLRARSRSRSRSKSRTRSLFRAKENREEEETSDLGSDSKGEGLGKEKIKMEVKDVEGGDNEGQEDEKDVDNYLEEEKLFEGANPSDEGDLSEKDKENNENTNNQESEGSEDHEMSEEEENNLSDNEDQSESEETDSDRTEILADDSGVLSCPVKYAHPLHSASNLLRNCTNNGELKRHEILEENTSIDKASTAPRLLKKRVQHEKIKEEVNGMALSNDIISMAFHHINTRSLAMASQTCHSWARAAAPILSLRRREAAEVRLKEAWNSAAATLSLFEALIRDMEDPGESYRSEFQKLALNPTPPAPLIQLMHSLVMLYDIARNRLSHHLVSAEPLSRSDGSADCRTSQGDGTVGSLTVGGLLRLLIMNP
eukprot:CAMPEP_0175076964 /NCGR_PEP_ID=MMETSP0052_2-20121109/23077_1 /TAXON_ID=51329 ORGANISM="Polytomella parva, Strain SAG 63-3" /NCGR_SAMPLE_ID=MMETSP0052_2 /ASSEMBLY_ACC=CAM_ASM_000194 /LENGTH=781 /DNA_ID=CAMNT_0016346277 /DNA_START=79 /DNA_END=2421 /DNA_ORIENTATION=+